MPNLAISLHATTDEQRTALVPPNRKYPLAEILEACRRFPLKKRSRITFEYVMLDGVNDTPDDARRLVRLLSGIKAKVNLIPLNPAPGIPYRPAIGRARRPLRADPRRPSHHGVGAKEPRPGHPRRVRSADRRGRNEEDGGAADGAASQVAGWRGSVTLHPGVSREAGSPAAPSGSYPSPLTIRHRQRGARRTVPACVSRNRRVIVVADRAHAGDRARE